jgi:hypothetical protein
LLTVDTAKLNDFLDDVSLLTVDEYVDRPFFSDTVSTPVPFMVLTVKDIAQRVYTLELYNPSQSQTNERRVPGLVNGVQWAFFDPEKIRNVVKPKAFFGK